PAGSAASTSRAAAPRTASAGAGAGGSGRKTDACNYCDWPRPRRSGKRHAPVLFRSEHTDMAALTPMAALIIARLVLTLPIVLGLLVAIIWLGVKLIGCIIAFLGSVFAGSVVAILLFLLIVAALALLVWFIFFVHRLPLSLIGLGNLESLPAIPFRVSELPG